MPRCVGAFLLLALSLSAAPQQTAPPSPPNAVPHRVTLDVVVTGKSDKPVAGLEQRDFTLVDNKQPLQILSFQAVDGTKADYPVEIILLIDEVNTSFQNVANEREQIKKFLRQSGGQIAQPVSMIFLSDSGATRLNPTRDTNALMTALDQNNPSLRTSRPSQGVYGAIDRFQLSLRALRTIAADEEAKPGRKLLIWMSPGWALLSGPRTELSAKDQQGIFNDIVTTSTALLQSRITLYSIDPLGAAESGFRANFYQEFLKAVRLPKQSQLGNLALQVLAVQSGGRALNSGNDIAGEIAAAMAEASACYVISFDAPLADGPNEYHALDIKLDKPGLKPRTRTGYYDQP
jgi:VWFA-related protein